MLGNKNLFKQFNIVVNIYQILIFALPFRRFKFVPFLTK